MTESPTQASPTEQLASVTSPQCPNALESTRTYLILICALGMLVCFFLPWVDILGISASGFDLQRFDQHLKIIWLIPVLASIALIACLTGRRVGLASRVAGISPFLLLGYFLFEDGKGLLGVLTIGAWLSLALGLFLILLPPLKLE